MKNKDLRKTEEKQNKKNVEMQKISINEARRNAFYMLPRWLFTLDITNDARVLYALVLDRYKLSEKNEWIDEHGYVYCYYSREQMCKDLNRSSMQTIKKIVEELKAYGLLAEFRQGLSKPNRLYVQQPNIAWIGRLYEDFENRNKDDDKKEEVNTNHEENFKVDSENENFLENNKENEEKQVKSDSKVAKNAQNDEKSSLKCSKHQESQNLRVKSLKNCDSRVSKFENQESQNLRSSNTKYNKTKYNNNKSNHIESYQYNDSQRNNDENKENDFEIGEDRDIDEIIHYDNKKANDKKTTSKSDDDRLMYERHVKKLIDELKESEYSINSKEEYDRAFKNRDWKKVSLLKIKNIDKIINDIKVHGIENSDLYYFALQNRIKWQIDYFGIALLHGESWANSILSLIFDVYTLDSDEMIKFGKGFRMASAIQSKFKMLDASDVDYVISSYKDIEYEVSAPEKYLVSCLFNAKTNQAPRIENEFRKNDF